MPGSRNQTTARPTSAVPKTGTVIEQIAHGYMHSWNDEFSFTATIHNHSPRLSYDGGSLVALAPGMFVQQTVRVPCIPPLEKRQVKIVCNAVAGLTIESLPGQFEFVLKDASDRIVNTATYGTDMRFYAPILESKRPSEESGQERYNILIFGPAGVTKSSFINLLCTLMQTTGAFEDRKRVIATRTVGGGMKHNTKEIAETRLTPTISIWDTFGLEASTWQGTEIDLVFKGLIMDGWKMSQFEDLSAQAHHILSAVSTAELRKPQACLFFVPANSLMVDNDPMLQDLAAFFGKIIEFDIQPLCVLTLADEHCPELRANAMGHHPKVEQMKMTLAKKLNIPLNTVFCAVNYTDEGERNFDMDRNAYRILEAAIRFCEHKVTADLTRGSAALGSDRPLNSGGYASTPRRPLESASGLFHSSSSSAGPAVGVPVPPGPAPPPTAPSASPSEMQQLMALLGGMRPMSARLSGRA